MTTVSNLNPSCNELKLETWLRQHFLFHLSSCPATCAVYANPASKRFKIQNVSVSVKVITTIMKVILLLLVSTVSMVYSEEEHFHTIEITAGTEECFYNKVEEGQTITVEYGVLSAGGQYAKLDINFRMVDPRGIPLVAEFRKRGGSHSFDNIIGDYKICFDNKFSVTSSKVVYFEVTVGKDDEIYDDLARVFRDGEQFGVEDKFEDNVQEIEEKLKKIKQDIIKSEHHQKQIQRNLIKDKGMAENNISRVDTMSMVLVVFMVITGVVQVVVVKRFFKQE